MQAAHESAAADVPAQEVRQGGEVAAGQLGLGGCQGGVAAAPLGHGAAPAQRGTYGLRVQLLGLRVDGVDAGLGGRCQVLFVPVIGVARRLEHV